MTIELLWFSGCSNVAAVRRLLREVVGEMAPDATIVDIDATDPATAARLRFPGSPTIRVDGRDVDPEYIDSGEYAPRCRRYLTIDGIRGVPERRWIEAALVNARGSSAT